MSGTAVKPGGEVVLYESADGKVRLDVRLEQDTVWLTQAQLVELFQRDQSVISRHVRNVFSEGELTEEGNMQKMHIALSDKPVTLYSLDTIISVGYRVKSRRGTQFRIWATRTLREHLLRGYSLNEKRLREKGFGEIEQALALMARSLNQHGSAGEQAQAMLSVVQRYTRSWRLLLEYDEERLAETPAHPRAPAADFPLADARAAIAELRGALAARGDAVALFGQEQGEQLAGILGAIEQTFGGERLYPSVQARAAHLLYFVIKDHPFTDGNKRIGSMLFLEYLRRNGALLRQDGGLRFADNALVALALLVAVSDPAHKDMMIRLILNLLDEEMV